MDGPKLVIVLLHGGIKHTKSKILLEYLEENQINGLTKICVGNKKTKDRILNNKYDLKIKEFPCIIIKKEGYDTSFYPGTIKNIKTLVNQLRNITEYSESESE